MQLREAGRVERRIGVVSCLLFMHTLFMCMHETRLFFVYVIFRIYSFLLGSMITVEPAGWAGRAFR